VPCINFVNYLCFVNYLVIFLAPYIYCRVGWTETPCKTLSICVLRCTYCQRVGWVSILKQTLDPHLLANINKAIHLQREGVTDPVIAFSEKLFLMYKILFIQIKTII